MIDSGITGAPLVEIDPELVLPRTVLSSPLETLPHRTSK